jgi:hypothetical protein
MSLTKADAAMLSKVSPEFETYATRRKHIITKPPRENWKAWSQWEIDYLMRHAGKKQTRVIAAYLDRSVNSVKGMARQLKIKLRCYGEKAPTAKYTDLQVEKVHKMYESGIPQRKIAELMEMPFNTVHSIVYFKGGSRGAMNADSF